MRTCYRARCLELLADIRAWSATVIGSFGRTSGPTAPMNIPLAGYEGGLSSGSRGRGRRDRDLLVEDARGAAPTIFGDENQTRDYVFVDDTVHAFEIASDRPAGRVVNIGTDVETSVNGIYRMLSDITGFGGSPTTGPPRPDDLRRSVLDVAFAGDVLRWKSWTHLKTVWRRPSRS